MRGLRLIVLGFASLAACGPQIEESDPSGSPADETGSDSTDNSACSALAEEACIDEPGCEPLLAQPMLFANTCMGPTAFVGCRAADCVEDEPCWVCSPGETPQWSPQCGCLPSPGTLCPWQGLPLAECECAPGAACEESWKFCEEAACTECLDWTQGCDCFQTGCAPGLCCGWEAYCLPGDALPDGACQ